MIEFYPIGQLGPGDRAYDNARITDDTPVMVRYGRDRINDEDRAIIRAYVKAHPQHSDGLVALMFSCSKDTIAKIRKT